MEFAIRSGGFLPFQPAPRGRPAEAPLPTPPSVPADQVSLQPLELPALHTASDRNWGSVLQSLVGAPSREALDVAARNLAVLTWDWLTRAFPDAEAGEEEAALALLMMLRAVQPEIYAHSHRVGELAARFARELEIDPADCYLLSPAGCLRDAGFLGLELASLGEEARRRLAAEVRSRRISLAGAGSVHDIGKLHIPRGILHKTGPLTQEEWGIVQLHPVVGEQILRPLPALRPVLPAVRGHHERWDGRGYPDGLAGKDIPLEARILCLADSYDAMTSERPYRRPMPPGMALREIAEGAGTQFDPDLALLFASMKAGS